MLFELLIPLGCLLVLAALWAWRRRRRAEAQPAFARTESDNSANAMVEQAMAFRRGQGVDLDFQAARRLFRRAAEMHHAQAQFEYGVMLERGLGGEREAEKGARWIEHAAKGGCIEARLYLGKRYLTGDGAEKNANRAEQYLRGVAESGMAEAQMMLGLLYRDAEPPLANAVAAAEWLAKAVAQRYRPAFFPLSELYERGVGVARDLKKADELLLQAADFGEAEAQLKLGKYYLTGAFGHAFPQDYRVAMDWFRRAANHGVAEAEYEVGVRYERNEGVDAPDMGLAIVSYLKAAEMGFAPAQQRIAQAYLYGQGVNQNLREARRWFAAAAAQGVAEAAKQAERLQAYVQEHPAIDPVEPTAGKSENVPEWKG